MIFQRKTTRINIQIHKLRFDYTKKFSFLFFWGFSFSRRYIIFFVKTLYTKHTYFNYNTQFNSNVVNSAYKFFFYKCDVKTTFTFLFYLIGGEKIKCYILVLTILFYSIWYIKFWWKWIVNMFLRLANWFASKPQTIYNKTLFMNEYHHRMGEKKLLRKIQWPFFPNTKKYENNNKSFWIALMHTDVCHLICLFD